MAQNEKPVGSDLDPAQTNAISGGVSCTVEEWVKITEELKQAYENLIDFTSHVIERVAGPAK